MELVINVRNTNDKLRSVLAKNEETIQTLIKEQEQCSIDLQRALEETKYAENPENH